MKFRNNGSEFILKYNSQDFTLPSGTFEVNDDALSFFIIKKVRSFGKDVECISDAMQEKVVKSVKAVVEEVKEESKKEEIKEESKREEVKKDKTNKKLKDLEESL